MANTAEDASLAAEDVSGSEENLIHRVVHRGWGEQLKTYTWSEVLKLRRRKKNC